MDVFEYMCIAFLITGRLAGRAAVRGKLENYLSSHTCVYMCIHVHTHTYMCIHVYCGVKIHCYKCVFPKDTPLFCLFCC